MVHEWVLIFHSSISTGWIVNAASMLGLVAHANTTCYTTSKHAVVGMTKQMALDYAQDRIHVGPELSSSGPKSLHLKDQRAVSRLCQEPNGKRECSFDVKDIDIFALPC